MGFVKYPFKHVVYSRQTGDEVLIIGVYVEELLVTGTSILVINKFKVQMNKAFDMSDLGKLTYYLGI